MLWTTLPEINVHSFVHSFNINTGLSLQMMQNKQKLPEIIADRLINNKYANEAEASLKLFQAVSVFLFQFLPRNAL